ncbi:MAG: transposase [Planctomycetaceae bacterium]|nr:transposase [Planctomycetaceae bacterium]
MFHAGLNLPWDWRIGPCDSSERQHALEMLESLPENSLLTGDAGFVGYDFARSVLESGSQLLVRVGANVKLLKKLGFVRESNGIVYVCKQRSENVAPSGQKV